MEEVWKIWKDSRIDTRGRRQKYGHVYEVSNFGRVKVDNVEYIPIISELGYLTCYSHNIHRMVAECFIPNPDNKLCVDHIDGNKLNNRADNLRWVTHKENCNNPNTLDVKGRQWINLYGETKFVKNNEVLNYLLQGWHLGRKYKKKKK